MKNKFLKSSVGLFLLGAVIADFLPSIADPIHFYLVNYIFPTITDKNILTLWQIFDWYILDAFFYFLLFILAWVMNIRKVRTIKIIITIGSIIGASVAIGILTRLIFKF